LNFGNETRAEWRNSKYRSVRFTAGLAVAALYFWIIGIGPVGERFSWDNVLEHDYGLAKPGTVSGSDAVNGYYDLLGRAFASAQLHLPVEPAPELLALPDPWREQSNRPYRLLDAALYRQHFYLYHGATPALLLFAPWYLITRQDFPENSAALLFALGGYFFLSALFTQVLSFFSIRLPLALYGLFLVALGVAQSVPFLLHRVKVYEVAIACGFFCQSAGFYFLYRCLIDSKHAPRWAALSGTLFGLAIGCRPHLAAEAICIVLLLLLLPSSAKSFAWGWTRSEVVAFAVPVAICVLAIAGYNYARFDSPLEFGTGYLLGDDAYRNFRISPANLVRGLYYLIVCPPNLVAEFPFVRLALRPLFNTASALPAGYFLEPTAGVLSLCPITVLAPLVLTWRKLWVNYHPIAVLVAAMFIGAAASIFIIAAVPFSSQRYEVDFLPFLLFAACVVAALFIGTSQPIAIRAAATISVAVAILYSIGANLALGIQGPYDQFVQASPGSYVHLARWFSPVKRFRPLLNPRLQVQAVFELSSCPSRQEPLLSAGEFGSRYLLSIDCIGPGRIRLISESSVRHPDVRTVDLPFTPGRYTVGLNYSPADRSMEVTWNGNVVLCQSLRFLVTTPSQLHYGWDPSLGNETRFEGRITPLPGELLEDVRDE